MTKLTYTIMEAAGLLGIGRSSAYEAARAGEMPTIRIGRRRLVPRAALDRLLAGATEKSTGARDDTTDGKPGMPRRR